LSRREDIYRYPLAATPFGFRPLKGGYFVETDPETNRDLFRVLERARPFRYALCHQPVELMDVLPGIVDEPLTVLRAHPLQLLRELGGVLTVKPPVDSAGGDSHFFCDALRSAPRFMEQLGPFNVCI